jgi:CRISPR/Cas system-associated protein Csm6
MAKKIQIIVDEERFNRMLIELNSSREQLLDCDENEWSEEVAELEDYFRNVERKEIS